MMRSSKIREAATDNLESPSHHFYREDRLIQNYAQKLQNLAQAKDKEEVALRRQRVEMELKKLC